MEIKGALKSFLATILYLVLFVIFAIIYFIVILFVIKIAADLVFESGTLDTSWAVLSAVVLTAATLLGGGASYFGDDE